MSEATTRLRNWRDRARPRRAQVVRALVASLGASLVSTVLLPAAVTLLVFSATRPSWQSVGAWLVVVEIVAFVRAPLRFNERLASHTLGYDAVTTWRQWLVRTVGHWSATTWSSHGTGDIADRALRDTDALSDLWVRGILPLVTTYTTLAIGDLVVALATWRHRWWLAPALLLTHLLSGVVLRFTFNGLVRVDRVVRRQRGLLTTRVIDGASVVHDLALLGANNLLTERVRESVAPLEQAQQQWLRRTRLTSLVAYATAGASLALVSSAAPQLHLTIVVALSWLAVGNADLVEMAHGALLSLVSVTAAGERLDELAMAAPPGRRTWTDGEIALAQDGQRRTLTQGSRIAVTGPSGSGKTTLLLALAGLADTPSPLELDGVSISAYDEDALRRAIRYVPADPHLVRGFVRDVLGMGQPVPDLAWEQLRALGLALEPAQRLENLSRGERQRFAVVRALVSSPTVVLLDEPTGGLGLSDTERLLDLLASSGVTVVVATHDPLVQAWCHDTIAL